ncbi:MAG TPA: AMP-dependent synthetase, partial [Methanoculleus sp.]|nr:AMP-dependent synthetase [Methanoculleus sp.]
MNFAEYLFEHSARKEDLFLAGTREELRHDELYQKVNACAERLHAQFGTQNEFLLVSDNTLFFIVSYLAIIKSGNHALVIEPRTSDADLDAILHMCDIACVLAQNKYAPRFGDAAPVMDEAVLDLPAPGDARCDAPMDDDETAVVLFTSGSTGTKKGVMLSHKNLRANTESIIRFLEITENDRIYALLPFSFTFGTSLLHTHLRAGGSMVMGNSVFPGAIVTEIDQYRCTGFAGVPSTYQILANKTSFLDREFPHLRYFQQAGGQLVNKYLAMIGNAFPGKPFYVMYGLTEATARCSFLPPEHFWHKLGSIGKGIPGDVHLEVVDDRGLPVGPGETGEIVVTGDSVMRGYYKDPDATAQAIRDGRLYTGDLATVDEDGFVYFLERKSSIIKSGGFRISPNEIEALIMGIDGVSACAVIGVADDLMGESVAAIVRPDNNHHSSSTNTSTN